MRKLSRKYRKGLLFILFIWPFRWVTDCYRCTAHSTKFILHSFREKTPKREPAALTKYKSFEVPFFDFTMTLFSASNCRYLYGVYLFYKSKRKITTRNDGIKTKDFHFQLFTNWIFFNVNVNDNLRCFTVSFIFNINFIAKWKLFKWVNHYPHCKCLRLSDQVSFGPHT